MRITEAARRLGTSPRMLRYRETLGLLPPTREHSDSPHPAKPPGSSHPAKPPGHRRFGDAELRAVALALELEKRYDISPAELAFGLRVLAEPDVRARVRDLGERIGRVSAPPVRALDFEKEKALRWLGTRAGARAAGARTVGGAGSPERAPRRPTARSMAPAQGDDRSPPAGGPAV